MKKLLLILSCVLFGGCAVLNNPASLNALITLGTVNAIQFGVPKEQQKAVASQIVLVGGLYDTLAQNGYLPTPDQFSAQLDRYLPDNASKDLTKTELLALYGVYYPDFKEKAPKEQLDFLGQFLRAVVAGAAPFTK